MDVLINKGVEVIGIRNGFKWMSYDHQDGVAVIAEGLVLDMVHEDLAEIEDMGRDGHGNVRIAEVNIGEILKKLVEKRLRHFRLKATIVAKNIGHELRCADPISRRYIIRLSRDNFTDPQDLEKFAANVGISPRAFSNEFGYLVKNEPCLVCTEPDDKTS
jgi:hypothetical protein